MLKTLAGVGGEGCICLSDLSATACSEWKHFQRHRIHYNFSDTHTREVILIGS